MRKRRRQPLIALGCLALAVPLAAGDTGPQVHQADIKLPKNPDAVVLKYTHEIHMLRHEDPGPSLRIRADGRVRVHRPAYMSEAGEYELRLGPTELQALFQELARDGILDFDQARAHEELTRAREAERARGVLHHISDSTEAVFEFRLRAFRPATDRRVERDYRRSIRWENPGPVHERHPDVSAARVVADAHFRLQALMTAPGLVRVR